MTTKQLADIRYKASKKTIPQEDNEFRAIKATEAEAAARAAAEAVRRGVIETLGDRASLMAQYGNQ